MAVAVTIILTAFLFIGIPYMIGRLIEPIGNFFDKYLVGFLVVILLAALSILIVDVSSGIYMYLVN